MGRESLRKSGQSDDKPPDAYWLFPGQLADGPSVIGSTVVMRGELILDEDLIIDGQFSGSVISGAHRLSIGACARVDARVVSTTADIAGTVEGNCDGSDTVVVRRTARIKGTVTASELRVEDGTNLEHAVLAGRIRLTD